MAIHHLSYVTGNNWLLAFTSKCKIPRAIRSTDMPKPVSKLPTCKNPRAAAALRVKDLLTRMTLADAEDNFKQSYS